MKSRGGALGVETLNSANPADSDSGLFSDSKGNNNSFNRRTEQQRNFLWGEDEKALTQLAEETGGAAYFSQCAGRG
jgi:hypothetical protein